MDRQSGNIRYSRSFRDWVRRHRWILALSAIALLAGGAAWAGAFIFSGEFYGPDVILHPAGYTGTQSVLNVNVCINEDTPLPAGATIAQMVTSIKNNIAIWNQLQPITGNALQGSANDLAWNQIDFESVALHELGHCIGLAHVNAASESGLPSGPNQNYTKATDGSNGLDLNPGSDGVIGSFDDIRGDDVNLHWFRMDTNDPGQLPLPVPVDGTTYDRDQSSLPTGHTFAANLDRTVAGTLGHTNTSTVKTEAVMQQVSYYDEDQRRLTADGAASILLAASGFDLIAGTADDYVLNLIYGGVVPPDSCDTMVQFTGMGGLANCQIGAYIVNSTHFRISTGDMNFGLGYNWYFNPRGPCRQTTNLTNGQWRQIALSCDPGTFNTVADVFGDDLTGTYGTNWIVHERNGGGYTALGLGDALQVGPGYWILTNQANQTVNIEGEFNGDADFALQSDPAGRFNLVGHRYWYDQAWADVRVFDGVSELTLDQADPAGACQGPDPLTNGCVMSRIGYKWNGAAYEVFDGATPGMEGTLENFDGFFVKAFQAGISLRIPDQKSMPLAPHTEATVVETPLAQLLKARPGLQVDPIAFHGKKKKKKEKPTSSWYIRLIVEAGELKDSGNVFGQLPDSRRGKDSHDLNEISPFGSDYLSVVFPHQDWGESAGDYASDFHKSKREPFGKDTWVFDVMTPEPGRVVTLSWEGPEAQLERSRLIDFDNRDRTRIRPGESYTFTTTSTRHRFIWRLKNPR